MSSPLVLLHGFMDTPRTWDLVRPALEREHEVLAPALPGHLGGPPFDGDAVGAIERAMDEAGFATAHVAGNSLGGWVALKLAERGRVRSIVAFAPAGGWEAGSDAPRELLRAQASLLAGARAAAAHADTLLATPGGRRRATELLTVNYEHLPRELLAHQLLGMAACTDGPVMIEQALRDGWPVGAASIDCPVRIVWGTEDRLLPWPEAAVRYRRDWLPHADWVVLDGVGHAPQLDVPVEAAQLILGFTAGH